MWVYIWLGITALALIVEFITSEMVSVWFIGGGIVSMILALIGLKWYIHVPVFIVVSLILMLCFRKLVIKKLNKSNTKTNAETVIGEEFRLLTAVKFNEPGSIKVNDVIWSVVAKNETAEIQENSIVKIVGIKGNKYIVEEVK